MVKRNYKKGAVICSENSAGQEMYIILKGKVKVYKMINGEEIVLSIFKDHDFFGEMSVLLHKHRTANVVAMEDTSLVALSPQDFIQKVEDDKYFALKMIKILAKRIENCHSIITKLEGEKMSLEVIYGGK